MKKVAITAMVLALASPVMEAAAGSYVVWGVGSRRCGAWIDAQRTNQAKAEAYQSWVHGFVTGAGFAREGLKLKDVDVRPETLTEWVDEYCLANPLMTIERAAVGLLDHIAAEK